MLPSVRIAGYEVFALSDVVVDFDVKQFFPTVAPERWAALPNALSPEGKLRLNIGCFLIQGRGRTVLVDAGLGRVPTARFSSYTGRLDEQLALAGASLADVDTVMFTHMHVDHTGWSVRWENGTALPLFPNARYLGPRKDWETFNTPQYLETPRFAYFKEFVQPLMALGVLDLIGDGHRIADGVRTWHTPGHTPGHMAVVAGDPRRGQLALIGDLLHHPIQLGDTTICPNADVDPDLSRRTRAAALDRLAREESLVAGAHMPPGFARLRKEGGTLRWEAVHSA